MKILVTGCKGMLGSELSALLSKNHEVVGTDLKQLDITDNQQTASYIKNINPEIVINCAAYTNVDSCETEKELAYKVNSIGPKNLAISCDKLNIPIVHISTDYVFDGMKEEPYLEDDTVNPLSIYGKSKLSGEINVKNHCNKFYIVRTQWLYGKNGPNFVKTMLRLFKENQFVNVVNDQFGQPTYVKDLSFAISRLIEQPNYGTYHITNQGIVSWFDFARDILELSGFNSITIAPCTTENFPRPAKRPLYSPIENYNLRLIGAMPLRNYREALEEYLNEDFYTNSI